ncbi:MAG TPA: NAD(P)-binding protein, partial [Orrella sp.]
ETPNDGHIKPDIIVFGLGRFGGRLARGLSDAGIKVLGVDFDPQAIDQFKKNGFAVRFGDGIEAALLESLPLRHTRWIVSTIPDITSNKLLLEELQQFGFTGEIAMVAREDSMGMTLKAMGVHNVLYPHNSAVDHVVDTLTEILAKEKAT